MVVLHPQKILFFSYKRGKTNMDKPIVLQDRQEAGQKLAQVLKLYEAENPIVLGMPRGGVVVAYEIAQELGAPLDVIVARKIGAPLQPEYAIGAIADDNVNIFNAEAIAALNITKAEIEPIIFREKKEIKRRTKIYRCNKPQLDLKGKTVMIVDDGVATGQTAIVTIRRVRKMQAQKIIFACGVCPRDAMILLQKEADIVISLNLPETFDAVGKWYQDFSQVTDAKVVQLLKQAGFYQK